jgi:hypothetical protein
MAAGSGCDGRRGDRHVLGEPIRPLRGNRQHRLLNVEGSEYLLDDVVINRAAGADLQHLVPLDFDGLQP